MKNLFILIVLLISFSQAKHIPISFSKNSETFFTNIKHSDNHKSMGLYKHSKSKENFINCEYGVVFSKPSKSFIDQFKTLTSYANLNKHYYDVSTNTLIFIPFKDSTFIFGKYHKENSLKSKEFINEFNKSTVLKLIHSLENELEYDRTNYFNKSSSYIISDNSMVGADIFFRRIFNNAIVSSEVSFIQVSVNGENEITSIKVKWPSFVKISQDASIDLDSCKSIAVDIINESIEENLDRDSVSEISIESSAQFWNPIQSDNKLIISPAVSFNVEFKVNDSKYSKKLNIPILRKYYK
jgi:hypothetical protein